MNPSSVLYFDYAATTPLDPRVLEAMMPYLTEVYYNASSGHSGGLRAQQAVMHARMTIARHIGAKMADIVFTSGATEAINLAVLGVTRAAADSARRTLVTAGAEHAAVLDSMEHCRSQGWNVVHLPVDGSGRVDLTQAAEVISSDVLLLSVMLVNNETGVIQDLATLSAMAREHGVVVMTDATQAYGKIPLNVDDLGVDLMTFSGHKIYGPKGVGVLYRRSTVPIEALAFGGGQEGGARSGTLNVPGIVGMAEAGSLALASLAEEAARIGALRDRFERAVTEQFSAVVNGADADRSYNISNVMFPLADVDAMLLQMPEVAISKGSACSSAKPRPSHVLTAMGRSPDEAQRSIRCSFGRTTTEQDVDRLLEMMKHAHEKATAAVTGHL